MRRFAIVFAAAAVVLAVAVPTLAKGPVGAAITGPGIDEPIVVTGMGEYSSGSHFSYFVEATGLWELAFAADFTGTGLAVTQKPPTKDLGDAYEVVWDMGDRTTIAMTIYPFAAGGAVTHVTPGTEIVGWDMSTHGGWFRTSEPLAPYLEEYGVPMPATTAKAPADTVDPAAAPVAKGQEAMGDATVATAAKAPPATAVPVAGGGVTALPILAVTVIALLAVAGWWAARRPRRVAAP